MMRNLRHLLFIFIVALALVTASLSAELPSVIDLSVTPGTESADVVRVCGETLLGLMGAGGKSVALGDLDGDGLSDLLIGSKEASSIGGATASGRVYVVFGDKNLERQTINLNAGEGVLDITRIVGTEPFQRNGSVVAAGDVNGDGIDDAVIGAAQSSLSGATQCGKVTVLYGSSEIRGTTVNLSSSSASTVILGATAWEHFGWSLAIGDVNSDGYMDVISVAMPAGNVISGAGKAYIIFGGPDLPGKTIQTSESTVTGDQALIREYRASDGAVVTDRLGYSVASGDVDGDGYDDVILGAPLMDSYNSYYVCIGGAFVVYGGASLAGTVVDVGQKTSGVTQIFGDQMGEKKGFSVASGDVNGDGYYEVILGAPNEERLVKPPFSLRSLVGAGAVYTVYGSPEIRGTTVDLATGDNEAIPGVTHILGRRIGLTYYDNLHNLATHWHGGATGWSVSSGDINGDGLDDVLAGGISGIPPDATLETALFEAGIADVIYGATGLVGTVIDLEADHAGVEVLGGHTEDRLGHTVASAGDMNGDGFAEFATSAPMAENPAINSPTHEAGMVALIKGDGVAAKARCVRRTGVDDPPPLRFGTAARCLIDYATAGEVSQTTVTIQHNAPENPPEGAESVLPVQWNFKTNQTQFTASAVFRYTDTELGMADEPKLEVFTSPDGSVGSWQRAGTHQVLNTDRNEIRVEGLSHFSLYSIAVIGEPTPTETPTPTITDTPEPTGTPTEAATITPTPDPTQVLLERADLNTDGRIDVKDLLILENLWLREVPE